MIMDEVEVRPVRSPGPRGLASIRPLTRDPTLAVLAFAVWSFLAGASLIGPGEVFLTGPYYQALLRLGLPEEVWGGVMLADAFLLVRTIMDGGVVLRSAVAAVSGGFWVYFGAQVLIGGFEAGVLSAVGCWEVCAGFGLLAATVQWAGHAGGPDAE